MPLRQRNILSDLPRATALFILLAVYHPNEAMSMEIEVKPEEIPPLVRVPPLARPPAIDGVISDGEWDMTFMGTGVAPHRKGGLDPLPVQYWFAYDAKRIYLAGRMQTFPGEIYNTLPRRLAGGGPSGHFEFLVDPHSCHVDHDWMQAMTYPLGKYENLGYSDRIGGYIPYDVEWEYKDSWKDGWWTAEMSAPVEAFRKALLQDGAVWGVLFGGMQQRAGPMYYFSGTLGELFRDRKSYLKMILDRNAPVVRITGMGDVTAGNVTPKVELTNSASTELKLKMRFTVADGPGDGAKTLKEDTQSAVVPAGGRKEFTWNAELPSKDGEISYLHAVLSAEDGSKTFLHSVYKLSAPRTQVWLNKSGDVAGDPAMLEAFYYPYFRSVRAVADFGGVANPEKAAEALFQVMDSKGAQIAEARTDSFDNRSCEAVIQLKDVPADGTYKIRCEILDKEKKPLAEMTDAFDKKSFPFEHNKIGVSGKVLYPWTPIQVDEKQAALKVWNREYSFGRNGFPEGITTAGEQILAAPICLVVKIGGKEMPLEGVSFRFTKVAENEADAEAEAKGSIFSAKIKMHAEYDGMLKYEVELTADPGAKIDGLDLVMPMRDSNARFLHAAGDGCRTNYSHEIPQGTGTVWNSKSVLNWAMPTTWLTYLWMGDYARGLCWWADSAEGWTLPKEKQESVVELVRRERRVEAVFHVVSRPTDALWKGKEPRRLVFAFEATPVRPRASWARDIGTSDISVTKQKQEPINWIGNTYWAFAGQEKENDPASGRYTFAHLRPINAKAAAALKEMTAKSHAGGSKILVYTDMRCRSLVGDEEKAYYWEWAPNTRDDRKGAIAKAPQHSTPTISSTQSRIDFDLWCIRNNMDLGIDCWYFDEIQDEGQIHPAAGLGYRDESGRWMPTGRLFQYRQLWKRLYTLMQEYGQKEPLIVIHNTSTTYAGPMAFCTATFDFEEMNTNPTQRQLTKFGIDYLIAESMGHQYGFVGTCLGGPQFEPWVKDRPEEKTSTERHWAGIHMLLDMNPYLLGSNPAVRHALRTLGEFGWNEADCQWIPYWEASAEGLYSYKPDKGIYVSAYKRGGKLLLIILNDTNRDERVRWTSTDKLWGTAEKKGEDISAEIDVPHFNYQALMLDAAHF